VGFFLSDYVTLVLLLNVVTTEHAPETTFLDYPAVAVVTDARVAPLAASVSVCFRAAVTLAARAV
jgi:hypothetical protein